VRVVPIIITFRTTKDDVKLSYQDIQNRLYLTFKVNSLFPLKRYFMRTSGDKKEKLPIKNDEESVIVDTRFEISNHTLIKDIAEIPKLEKILLVSYEAQE
jgi:hypothetical protein